MNVKLKNKGRKAKFMTEEEFAKKILKIGINNQVCEEDEKDYKTTLMHLIMGRECYTELSKVTDDLSKIVVDSENVDISGDFNYHRDEKDPDYSEKDNNIDLLGYQVINGISFIGGAMGGDWEEPVYFIIYWDGKNLRGYIPTKGNTFNIECKAAFGSLEESDKYESLCEKYGTDYEGDLIDRIKKQELSLRHSKELVDSIKDTNDVMFWINWDGVLEDITARIELIK